MTNVNILIVEDEEEFSRTLERHLRRLNYAVLGVARSGEEAQRLAEVRRPDLVLSDVSLLGGMDGFQLAERLWRPLDVPVIFLTGHVDLQTVERVQQAKSFGYLSKPFRGGELKAAIELALMRHATEQHHKKVEQALLAAIRCAGDAVVMTDAAGVIQFVNPAAESLLELKSELAVGRSLTEVIGLANASRPSSTCCTPAARADSSTNSTSPRPPAGPYPPSWEAGHLLAVTRAHTQRVAHQNGDLPC